MTHIPISSFSDTVSEKAEIGTREILIPSKNQFSASARLAMLPRCTRFFIQRTILAIIITTSIHHNNKQYKK
jgi:hypothetical protein